MTEPYLIVEATLTRRRLVCRGAATAAGLYLLGALPASALAVSTPAFLCRSSYTTLVGAAFPAVDPAGAVLTLRLLEVADLSRASQTRSLAGSDDAFALTFSGPPSPLLGSGIRSLRHPSLGWISLFITPAGRPSTEQRYEVVVDRAATSRLTR